MKKLVLLLLICVVILSACSITEPSTSTVISINTTAHKEEHQNDGDDEVNITGLSGLATDDQHVLDNEVIDAVEAEANIFFTGTQQGLSLGGQASFNNASLNLGSWDFYMLTMGSGMGITGRNSVSGSLGWENEYYHDSDSPADNDVVYREHWYGRTNTLVQSRIGYMDVQVVDVTAGTVNGQISWFLMDGAGTNLAMLLSSSGNLSVDLGFGTFDKFDDAQLLRDSIKKGDMEKLVAIGVATRGYTITESGEIIEDGYLVSINEMIKLVSGGVYQNRDKIDALQIQISELEAILIELEAKLK